LVPNKAVRLLRPFDLLCYFFETSPGGAGVRPFYRVTERGALSIERFMKKAVARKLLRCPSK
jgi:hypothetical protein